MLKKIKGSEKFFSDENKFHKVIIHTFCIYISTTELKKNTSALTRNSFLNFLVSKWDDVKNKMLYIKQFFWIYMYDNSFYKKISFISLKSFLSE